MSEYLCGLRYGFKAYCQVLCLHLISIALLIGTSSTHTIVTASTDGKVAFIVE